VYPGVAHEDVDTPKHAYGSRHDFRGIFVARDIGSHSNDPAPRGVATQRLTRILEPVVISRAYQYIGAVGREGPRNSETKTTAPAGDDRYAVVKSAWDRPRKHVYFEASGR
jgi:hypothetical protein